jgi:hypothetical protein
MKVKRGLGGKYMSILDFGPRGGYSQVSFSDSFCIQLAPNKKTTVRILSDV